MLTPSTVSLVVVNLVPLAGVAFFGWSTFAVLLLYWSENVAIGIVTIVKMICARGRPVPWERRLEKAVAIPGFVLGFGAMCAIHVGVIVGLFGNWPDVDHGPGFGVLVRRVLLEENGIISAAALFASHLVSLVQNYFILGERGRASLSGLFEAAFSRVIVLHLALFFGAALLLILRNPAWGVALLVTMKIALDVRGHIRERLRFAAAKA